MNYYQSHITLLWIRIMLCQNICELYLLYWMNPFIPIRHQVLPFQKSCHQVHLAASFFINNNLFQLSEGDCDVVAFHPFQLYEIL